MAINPNDRNFWKKDTIHGAIFYARNRLLYGKIPPIEEKVSSSTKSNYNILLKDLQLDDISANAFTWGKNTSETVKKAVMTSYELVTMNYEQYFQRVAILSTLEHQNEKATNGLSKTDVCQKTFIDYNSVNRLLEEMVNDGTVTKIKNKFFISRDVFEGIDQYSVRNMVSFLTEASAYGGMLHGMGRAIDATTGESFMPDTNIVFDHTTFHQTLDEYVVWTMMSAYSEEKKVRFSYWKKNDKAFKDFCAYPIRVVYENLHGRTYVLCYTYEEDKEPYFHLFRADRMLKPVVTNESFCKDTFFTENVDAYLEQVEKSWNATVDPNMETERVILRFINNPGIKYRVTNERRQGEIDNAGEDYFYYKIELPKGDVMSMITWINSFGGASRVIEPAWLKDYIDDTRKSVLEMYGDE